MSNFERFKDTYGQRKGIVDAITSQKAWESETRQRQEQNDKIQEQNRKKLEARRKFDEIGLTALLTEIVDSGVVKMREAKYERSGLFRKKIHDYQPAKIEWGFERGSYFDISKAGVRLLYDYDDNLNFEYSTQDKSPGEKYIEIDSELKLKYEDLSGKSCCVQLSRDNLADSIATALAENTQRKWYGNSQS